MNKITTVTLLTTLVLFLSLGLVTSGCTNDSANGSGQDSEPASVPLGRVTGIAADSTQEAQMHELAPNFEFLTAEGTPSSLSELQGNIVLINFWSSNCQPCVQEMPLLQQVYDEWTAEGVVVLAINTAQSQSTVSKFIESYGYSFPVLLDTNLDAFGAYGFTFLPATVLIDKDGTIRGIKAGAFQSVEEIEGGFTYLLNTE